MNSIVFGIQIDMIIVGTLIKNAKLVKTDNIFILIQDGFVDYKSQIQYFLLILTMVAYIISHLLKFIAMNIERDIL